jgi:hypothetical protein
MRTVAVLLLVLLAVPYTCTAIPEDPPQNSPLVADLEFNVTGVNITNHSIPSRYAVTPSLIDVRFELSDTSLPAQKGEMASGPRTIGFSADPVVLVLLVIVISAVTARIWYLVRRKPEEPEHEDNGGE